MANAKKCDVCGKFYQRNSVPNIYVSEYKHGFSDHKLDLCDSCQEKLEEFLNGKKRGE